MAEQNSSTSSEGQQHNPGSAYPAQPLPTHYPDQSYPQQGSPGYAQSAYPQQGSPGYAQSGYPQQGSPGYAQSGYPQQSYAPTAYQPPTNTKATIALICSIVGFGIFLSLPAGIILGHIALSEIKRTNERGQGMALAAVIIGYCGIALIMLIIFFYAIFFYALITSTSHHYYHGI